VPQWITFNRPKIKAKPEYFQTALETMQTSLKQILASSFILLMLQTLRHSTVFTPVDGLYRLHHLIKARTTAGPWKPAGTMTMLHFVI
jgi:hypothetical protein